MPPDQTPTSVTVGSPDTKFTSQNPFTVYDHSLHIMAARTQTPLSRTRKAKPTTSKKTVASRNSSARKNDGPKTTHPPAASRREEMPQSAVTVKSRKLDAFPDRIDVRDWVYQPVLSPLPNRIINCHDVTHVLDQKSEGACTGFALAAVINFLLHRRNINQTVSPRMLYELARRYDEWPGENYEGSSARGAMKGWVRHGVCCHRDWEDGKHGLGHFTPKIEGASLEFPGGHSTA